MPINYEKGVLPEDYVPNTYESLGNMIGKIAEQKITTVDATNKLAIFSKKLPMNGDTIEQVVIKLSNSTAYDPEGAGALTRQNPSLAVRMFKTWNRRKDVLEMLSSGGSLGDKPDTNIEESDTEKEINEGMEE